MCTRVWWGWRLGLASQSLSGRGQLIGADNKPEMQYSAASACGELGLFSSQHCLRITWEIQRREKPRALLTAENGQGLAQTLLFKKRKAVWSHAWALGQGQS